MKYTNDKEYFDEVMQEESIGLFEAYQKYDPNQYSVKFWSYAWYRVRGRMINFIEIANKLKIWI
ncbi:sigma factor [Paenibacillus sp. NPDC056722]|uniref:sigma factor n=1 Tax=Paenibacillus sp. NPDC056722 TaxID=3345924 RepID=UPI0036C09A2C